ncbi:hypothetical protein [Streptomyces sp. NPDC003077]|uniref:hypothetical protein n=1 Tax=Streptomyces sp. NPDC003077 TaxID=3154443 RepID=UPI0033B80DD5
MNYLRGFIPWIAYAVVSSAGWQWGALTGLLLACGLLLMDRAAGFSLDLRLLDYGTIVFFAALAALALARPDSGLRDYGSALSSGWLALIAWTSLAVRRPFTLAVARRMAPPEVWKTRVFLRINVVLTAAWALSFTLTAAAQAVISAYGLGTVSSVLVQLAGFAVPIRFTAVYPERARARFLRQAGMRIETQGV